ncbi:MAG: hypothetical protein WC604_01605 [Candidatus Gracilibacteria bacterium]
MSKDKERKNLEKLHKKIQKSEKESLVEDIQVQYKQQVSDEFEIADDKIDKSEVISAKKVVYIEIDDEVTTVYDKVRDLKMKHIYLVVPRRAVLFQSIVNLKILKRKASEDGKGLYIITNDKNGIYLAEQVGLPVYDKVSTEGKPVLFSSTEEDEKLRITPLKATVNAVIDEAPTRRTERKLSISEILSFKRDKKSILGVKKLSDVKPKPFPFGLGGGGGGGGSGGDVAKEAEVKAKKEEKIRKHRLVLVAPNKQALIGLAAVSILILMVIFYVALPGATLYLTPSASVLEKSVNVTLAEYEKNKAELEAGAPHMIASYQVTAKVERSAIHFATGKELSSNASNASGNITIINTAGYEWPLVATTRFQTNEGLVFRIPEEILVPAATSTGPGKVDVYVVADSVDAFGQIVGEKGNIGPTKFFLPGLKDSSRSVLYAESKTDMKGGVTDYTTFVSDEDIEAAKLKLKEVLYKAVDEELNKEVDKKNDLAEADYILLVGEGAVWTGDVTVNPVTTVSGQGVDQFEVSGYLTASGYCYSKSEMTAMLTQELMLKKSPQKKLVKVNEDTITYRIFEKDSVWNKIKITANIKGIEEFDIDPEKENGARLINKIKEHILGKNITDAKNYIQNLPEINKVEIDSWPAWSPTIPSVPDNIDIEVRDAVTVE